MRLLPLVLFLAACGPHSDLADSRPGGDHQSPIRQPDRTPGPYHWTNPDGSRGAVFVEAQRGPRS